MGRIKHEYKLKNPYDRGEFNKVDGIFQIIRLSEGCPWKHPFCAESFENPEYKIFDIPKLIKNNVKIIDMNLLCHPEALEIINELGRRKCNGKVIYYELTCGIDWRFLTQEIAIALRQSRFRNIRLAWDFAFEDQKNILKAITLLKNAGYRTGKYSDITIFMICNWKIPYDICQAKLELCKIWNVKVSDCWFDNQISPDIKPLYWNRLSILMFRKSVRKHNQLVNFQIDPEQKTEKPTNRESKNNDASSKKK